MIIRHRTGEYPITFGPLNELLTALPGRSFVITDRNVHHAFSNLIPKEAALLVLEPGEGNKTPESYLKVIEWLWQSGAQRNATVVALGGGVIGDLAGFAAATYMRGIQYLQIPTTLLAQVDSSVGGKVGVDLKEGKNMLGAFYPPTEVRISIDALQHLPTRQFANGMAEVLKYGFIMDPSILAMGSDKGGLQALIVRCIECKRDVVEADELETTGLRAILNFGHTVGHALEFLMHYEGLLHGEAISIGMCVEASLSEQLGLSPAGTRKAVQTYLERAQLPISHPLLANHQEILAAMRRDKKSTSGKLAFSLLRGVGRCELINDVPEQEVVQALSQ